MTTSQILIIALSGVALAGVLGAFAIAYRRSAEGDGWKANISRDARKADKSALETPVIVAEAEVIESEQPEIETPETETAEPEPQDAPAGSVQAVDVVRVEELSAEEAGVSRRQFFTRALGVTFGAFMGLNGMAYLAFLWPRLSGGFGSDIDVGAVDDIQQEVKQADGSVLPKFVPEARAYIVPFAEGDIARSQFGELGVVANGLTALFQRCVHLGCRVPWCETSQGFECPCHGSKYNFLGEYQAGPAPRNLDRFAVEEVNGRLIVKTGTILQTPRAVAKTVKYPQGPSCIALDTGDE